MPTIMSIEERVVHIAGSRYNLSCFCARTVTSMMQGVAKANTRFVVVYNGGKDVNRPANNASAQPYQILEAGSPGEDSWSTTTSSLSENDLRLECKTFKK